ncbi:MAG: TlpA family protein disulfide reductase [Acidobacteriota bacterium]|nr:TlpA family protein disulfide reductase [Acidobacteriota bacterium]
MPKLLAALVWGLMIVTPKVVAQPGNLVDDVKAAIAQKNVAKAESEVHAYQVRHGVTPDLINAIAWLGRGALAEKRYDKADAHAAEVRKLVTATLKNRKLDAEPQLPLALGASIEIHSQVMNARGQRAESVGFLREELKTYRDTSIRTRIQKNINLLSLEGKPAPALEIAHWLGPKPVSLAQSRGHPVLLFFWAHWCSDCKAEVTTIQRINAAYGPQGLILLGPTQRYGYVAGGIDATPDQELRYIDEVRKKYYARIGSMAVPVSEHNFSSYGASTTPTLVLIDRTGIVRMYNPGNLTYEELAARIEQVLGNKPQS